MADYDLIIIGSGPGGYVAAVRDPRNWGSKPPVSKKRRAWGGSA